MWVGNPWIAAICSIDLLLYDLLHAELQSAIATVTHKSHSCMLEAKWNGVLFASAVVFLLLLFAALQCSQSDCCCHCHHHFCRSIIYWFSVCCCSSCALAKALLLLLLCCHFCWLVHQYVADATFASRSATCCWCHCCLMVAVILAIVIGWLLLRFISF